MGIEVITLTLMGSKVEWLCKYTTEACVTWQTFNWSLFHAPFYILDFDPLDVNSILKCKIWFYCEKHEFNKIHTRLNLL